MHYPHSRVFNIFPDAAAGVQEQGYVLYISQH